MIVKVFENDISLDIAQHYSSFEFLAVDTENEGGLEIDKYKLTLIQFCDPKKEIVSIVKMPDENSENIKHLLAKKNLVKIFHHARFDLSFIYRYMGVKVYPIFCTRLMSKIINSNLSKHGLNSLIEKFFNVRIDKGLATSGFKGELTTDQKKYAVNDVLYLCDIKDKFVNAASLQQLELANICFDIIPYIAVADCAGLEKYGAKIFDFH